MEELHVLPDHEELREQASGDEDELVVVDFEDDPLQRAADFVVPPSSKILRILVEPRGDEIEEEEQGQLEAVVLGFLVDHVLVGLGLIDFLIVVGDAKFEIVKLLIFLVGMIKTLSNGAKNQDGSGQTCHENSQLFAQFVFSLVVDEGLVVAK